MENPPSRRQITARLNRLQRKGLTPSGRQKLRETARANRPWQYSTGPKTPTGKATSAANGRAQQKKELSVRELRTIVADATGLARSMAELRRLVTPAK